MNCHGASPSGSGGSATIALVGHSNVGKSALFHRLTGTYVNVSNYPGTTVEVARAPARGLPGAVIVDTPGIVTLPSGSEDEQLTSRLLLQRDVTAIVQVGDAKNLRRTLLLTVQLAELGLPMVLTLNMADEARRQGVRVDAARLAARLGVPVVPTVAVEGDGVDDLRSAIASAAPSLLRLEYPAVIESAIRRSSESLPPAAIQARALALLWLLEDAASEAWIAERVSPDLLADLRQQRADTQRALAAPISEVVHRARLERVEALLRAVVAESGGEASGWAARLGRLAIHPVWGLPILLAVLAGLYLFVGVFGAQTVVGWLEGRFFGEVLNPRIVGLVTRISPAPLLTELLVGEYGLWTMGMTYALALILPIVTTFFLAFGVLEDSGYLPRLAVLTHRVFRLMGLNGKAVLPMILGLGCVTTATVTTRILETRRDRLLATLLLALAVPCSAQLGVVMGMLAGVSFSATLVWSGVVLAVLLAVGWLAAQVVPGEASTLLVEVPPLRRPVAANVVVKTAARLEWYLREVVPFFLFGALLVFVLDQTGLLARLVRLGEPLVTGWLGLPAEAGPAFVLGFLRRDFGATGLFVLGSRGLLSPLQTVVAMVTITLFIPCLAAVMMIARERGWRTALAIAALVFPLAFLVGGVVRLGLIALGWPA